MMFDSRIAKIKFKRDALHFLEWENAEQIVLQCYSSSSC